MVRPLVLLAYVATSGVAAAQTSRGALTPGSLAITNVTVIPMTRDTALTNQTVIVENGRIAAIVPSRGARIPTGARRIDGTGKYLVPGLADMHTHLYSDEYIPHSLAPRELAIMLANGVTTARLMIGTPEQLTLRKAVMDGSVLGPQLWLASPQLTGRQSTNAYVVTTPEQARAAVDSSADAGYDLIKITNFITLPVYDAIIAEARTRRIPVDGHVNLEVGVAHALESQQGIQHLDGYFEAALADSAPMRVSVTQYEVYRLRNWKSLDYIDDRKVHDIAVATARSGVYSTPTLTLFNSAFAINETDEQIQARPDWQVIPEEMRSLYLQNRTRYWNPANDSVRTPARRERYLQVRSQLVKGISDAGGKLMIGSDSPDFFMAYGWTVHREMASFVAAGLTPWQALEAATRNPAEFLGAGADWGTVQVGRRADLLLLTADPRSDIGNTTKIDAVAIGGRWITKQQLDAMLAAAVSALSTN